MGFVEFKYYVYILASKKNGTLYIGMTNNILRRVAEHKQYLIKGFTQKYKVHILVYYERYSFVMDAIKEKSNSRNGIDNGKSI